MKKSSLVALVGGVFALGPFSGRAGGNCVRGR